MNTTTSELISAMNNDVIYTPYDFDGIKMLSVSEPDTSEITLRGGSQSEMLKITKDGFYVRGVKVEQDEREAEIVYNAFHQWLTWAVLNRSFN